MTMNEAPPPMPPTGLLMKRCKFIWRFLLLSNLALGGPSVISRVFLSHSYSIQERSFLNPFDGVEIIDQCMSLFEYFAAWKGGSQGAKRRDSMEIHRKTAQKLHKGKATVEVPPEPITSSMDLDYDDFIVPVTMPVEVWAPIPEEQQREIFKWILEEKRKVKPKDGMEKKQIDDEKAILKQFLRAKTIPKF